MTLLRRLFRCLHARSRKPWNLVVSPDPKVYPGWRLSPTEPTREYIIRFDSCFTVESYLRTRAREMFNHAVNQGSKDTTVTALIDCRRTLWIAVQYNPDRKTVDGETAQDVLREMLDNFPRYDLQTPEGIETATDDAERRLANVRAVFTHSNEW